MTPLDTLLHDTAHDLGRIINQVSIIEMIDNQNLSDKQRQCLRLIKESHKDLRDKLDAFYKEHNVKFITWKNLNE